jgi:dTDP-glucose pyrophosphorylase
MDIHRSDSKPDKRIEERSISRNATILEALRQMDQIDRKLLLVFDDDRFVGLLSIGDIQRAIIANHDIQSSITSIIRLKNKIASPGDSFEKIKEEMIHHRAECMPVVDADGKIKTVIFWEDLFPEKSPGINKKLKLPVVIMAGGKGIRMRPLTHIMPKPLLPLDDKSILEHIIDTFREIGSNHFYLSLNYKAELILFYLEQLNLSDCQIDYIQEDKPAGTIGSLSLLKNKIDTSFFVTNCDILINQDYTEIFDFHRVNQNELTLVSAFKHISLPYGTIQTAEEGSLISIMEKPDLTFKVNTGFYILEPSLLKEIPENTYFDITNLIDNILKRKGKIGVFPISENSWKDIGEWNEYMSVMKKTDYGK